MKTMLDYVFEELIEDLEKWHEEYHNEEDSEEGLVNLIDILEDYKCSSGNELKYLEKEPEQDYDEFYYKNKEN